METLLRTENLTKKFKNQVAIQNISMNVPENSVYGLLGPNGAGKSTTLKMIAGILKPTKGSIIFNKHPWKRSDLSNIGALIETPPLYGNLTARENLKVRTELLNISDGRIDEVLEISGLTGTGKKRAGQFSMGMKQRLGIAIALLNNPKLLILDEPTNGLDPVGIEELRNLIRQFPKQGMTVILSSHILSEVEQIADYIGIICNGKLEYEAPENKEDNLEALFMDIVKRNRKLILFLGMGAVAIVILFLPILFSVAVMDQELSISVLNTVLYSYVYLILGNIVTYIIHFWLSLKSGLGASVITGVLESLIVILFSNLPLKLVISWEYIPWAWAVNMCRQEILQFNAQLSTLQPNIIFKVIIITFVLLLVFCIWFEKWEGRKNYEE